MMTEMDVAILVLKSAMANGSWYAEAVVDEAMGLHPDLPWLLAARGLAEIDNEFNEICAFVEAATVSNGA